MTIAAHHPLSDLTAALIAKIRVPSVTTLTPGGVVNELIPNSQLPAVRVMVRGKPVGPIAGATIWECEAEIDSFANFQGDTQNFGILNVIAALLNLQALVVAGWRVILMSVLDIVNIPDEELNGARVKRLSMPVLIHVVAA